MPAPRTERGERGGRQLRLFERLLFATGAAMLGCYGYFTLDAGLTQREARQRLEQAARAYAITTAPTEAAVVPGRTAARSTAPHAAVPVPARGLPVGELTIPRIQLSSVVLHGSDPQTLRRGPGHLETTPLPGESGNAVIAGHRDSFFRPLRHVRRGDDVFVQTPSGRFHYRVVSLQVVDAHDLSVLEPTRDPTLTLITCYPFWVFGSAPDRFIVRAARVSSETSSPLTIPAVEESAVHPPPAGPPARTRRPPPIPDDETLVRDAIERFRRTYNARVINRPDANRHSLLAFDRCDIAWLGDRAVATCGASSGAAAAAAAEPWRMTLDRMDGGWAIRSVQSP
jgi:sortase A